MLALNVLLACAAIALAWKLASDWRAGGDLAANAGVAGGGAGAGYVLPAAQAVGATGGESVARNPFFADRSSRVVEPVATAVAGPPPQLPVVIGTMRLGAHYEALMAENAANASTSFKQMKQGSVIGGYKVVEIRDDEVVVELNGERTTINVYLSASGVARTSARTVATPEPAASTAPRVETAAAAGTTSAASSSAGTSGTAPAVEVPSPDPLLKITVEGNRRRYERATMFGPQVWYEDIR